MLLPAPEITSSARPGTGNTLLSGLPPNAPNGTGGGSGMLPAVLVSNPNQVPGPPPPPPPKPKPTQYDFRYEDSDTLMQEIDEFYSYSEMDRLGSKKEAFQSSFGEQDWVSSSPETKENYLRRTLGELSSSDSSERVAAASALCYVLSGSWKEAMGPEHQLHLLTTNSTLLRSLGGLAPILDNLGAVSQAHSVLHTRADDGYDDASHSPAEEIETLDTELSLALEMVFLTIEVGRGDEKLAAELMSRDPPTLIFLMQVIASLKDTLKERALKTFPLKKLLLVTWKVLLASLGGLRDAQKVATLNRELEDLPAMKSDWQGFAKSSAGDIARFRTEMSVKYPTFDPTPAVTPTELTHHLPRPEKLAEALAPIPVRPHYHAPLRDPTEDVFTSLFHSAQPPSHSSQPMPLTPAPSPTPSPQMKPKKEKWQTDPLRPFIFPFSSAMGGRKLPAAIKEADDLFTRHMYIPLGVWQLWREREEFIREDLGVPALSLGSEGEVAAKADGERAERVEALEREAERAKDEGDFKASRKMAEKLQNLKKLDYVETIYKGVLSSTLPSTVVVLLKQILATLPAQPPAGANGQFGGTAIASPGERLDGLDSIEFPDEEKKPEPTVPEVDAMREKEIISKAGSAIILLLMKWFKSAHVLKFQHLSQLLLDMNCPLIMVKTFLLQDSVDLVKARNEVDDQNFFRFCMLNHSSHPPPKGPEDSLSVPPPRMVPRRAVSPSGHPGAPDDEEVELLSDYSWRNFFSAINRIKIIQKLLKGRTHQIHQFNQYKTFNTFKRMLKVQHPMFQLQVLKIIKAQIPHYGKKWKQQNMKIVTAIYLNCRPDLRDEWLVSVMEKDELEESSLQEQALRSLVRFYHSKHYSHLLSPPLSHHGRSGSTTGPYFHPNGSSSSQHHDHPHAHHLHRRSMSSSGDGDIFPPNRTRRISSSSPSRLPEDAVESWQHEYEDVLEDVFGESEEHGLYGSLASWGPLAGALADLNVNGDAWLFGEGDDFSDVSSIASIGELGGRARLDDGEEGEEDDDDDDDDDEIARPPRSPVDEVEADEDADDDDDKADPEDPNRNNWEHLSALTKSPVQHPRRRSSGGSPLRPVMKGNGIDGPELTDDIEELEELGPIQKEESHGPAVDEVEAMYGE